MAHYQSQKHYDMSDDRQYRGDQGMQGSTDEDMYRERRRNRRDKMRAQKEQSDEPPSRPNTGRDVSQIMEKLLAQCLKRGPHGIKTFGRKFRIMDDDGSKSLNFEEFKKGMRETGMSLSAEEAKKLFAAFDTDGNGSLNFDEFLKQFRPPMSKARKDLIRQAYDKLDHSDDGFITIDDLKQVYSVTFHPKYKSGEWTKKQVLQEYLNSFQLDGDDTVTYEEFLNYYSGVSASIDKDVYFDYMMRQAWKI